MKETYQDCPNAHVYVHALLGHDRDHGYEVLLHHASVHGEAQKK